ncbi:hypothetical protein GCM10023185_08880 [Hymenobacter saemangeumensis]|uniref:Tetratricopeptide repeat protein n=1 Tax=Hymenobacter saemangeumensis TaxID=1084522 RepID=A0ABP8I3W9_9BACT
MLKRLILGYLFLLSTVQAFACGNGRTFKVAEATISLSNGAVIALKHSGRIVPYGCQFVTATIKREIPVMYEQWKKTQDLAYLSDYALLLAFTKEYEKARDTYLYIESIAPDQYSTAANLGTVYELLGDNRQALSWIRKAVRIDPASHMGSEWLHVKILEAKLQGKSAVNSKFLLNTSFGTDVLPHTSLSKAQLLKLRDALFYQLNERVSFIQPQETIVAQLLFDLANVAYLTGAKSESKFIYTEAQEYGYSNPLLAKRLAALSKAGVRSLSAPARLVSPSSAPPPPPPSPE